MLILQGVRPLGGVKHCGVGKASYFKLQYLGNCRRYVQSYY